MDSFTQIALGAGVGVCVLGRDMAPRKAALVGGALGLLPDLDLLVPFDDPIDAFVLHRTVTHSLVVQALAAPVFGEALVRLFKALRERRLVTYLAVYLVLATHALLDAQTIYGTRVFWPLWGEAVGTGSIFIIDPLYSLPLVVAFIWALCLRTWTARLRTVLVSCLALSTGYLAWSLAAQQVVESRAATVLSQAGVRPERLLATPTPFNTLYWKVIALEGERYLNLYLPVFGAAEAVALHVHPRGAGLARCLEGLAAHDELAAFSDGFYRVDHVDGELVVSDLRMGLTPNYVFRYALAEETAEGFRPIPPRRRRAERRAPGDLVWLFDNVSGSFKIRPAEARAAVDAATLATLPAPEDGRGSC